MILAHSIGGTTNNKIPIFTPLHFIIKAKSHGHNG